ncbi:MAG TPA: ATP-binding protein, partial [Limnobacter sp.]|nr:ATP-binding protein [Limnobacter sp.]
GGLAHDFNNSLTVVLGSAERLQDEIPEDSPLRHHVDMILKAAMHGAQVTSSLLAFARKQPLKPMVVDLSRIVESMRNLLETTLGERIELGIEAQPRLWHALIDPSQFESALLNLCLNARDAMPSGGALALRLFNQTLERAHVRKIHELNPGDHVVLQVQDCGCGMDSTTLVRVFEPFFTTKEVGKGSGLGLSMVYGFIKQSDGHIDVQSAPGEGTTMTIYLPKALQTVDTPKDDTCASVKPKGMQAHVLLVEDDDLVRQHVESLLIGMGYRVTAMPNAMQCIQKLDEIGPVDLLFSDIVMPGGMSGTQLATEIRQKIPDLPILLTSGYAEDVFSGVSSELSGVSLLKKPYRRNDLAMALNNILQNAGAS